MAARAKLRKEGERLGAIEPGRRGGREGSREGREEKKKEKNREERG